MGLVERLMGWQPTGEDLIKIPVHQFTAAMAEWNRGFTNKAQIVALFSLRPEDEVDADALIAQFAATNITRQEFHDILLLAEIRAGYDTPTKVRNRLGI